MVLLELDYVIFTASANEIEYKSFLDVINPRDGGLAIHGALIAVAIYLPIFCKLNKIKLLTLLEIALPLILFAQVIATDMKTTFKDIAYTFIGIFYVVFFW